MRRTTSKKIIPIIFALTMMFPQSSHAATIGNIRCEVTKDEKINIYYQLTGKGTYTVTMEVSTDGGKTFDIKPVTLSGDAGEGISAGTTKKIEWDVLSDISQLSGNMVVILEASREPDKPINKWLLLAGIVLTGGAIAAMGGGGGGKSSKEPPMVEISYGLIQINVEFPE